MSEWEHSADKMLKEIQDSESPPSRVVSDSIRYKNGKYYNASSNDLNSMPILALYHYNRPLVVEDGIVKEI